MKLEIDTRCPFVWQIKKTDHIPWGYDRVCFLMGRVLLT